MAFVKRRKGERQRGDRRTFLVREVYGGQGSLAWFLYGIFPSTFDLKLSLAQRKEHHSSRKHWRLQANALSAYS